MKVMQTLGSSCQVNYCPSNTVSGWSNMLKRKLIIRYHKCCDYTIFIRKTGGDC